MTDCQPATSYSQLKNTPMQAHSITPVPSQPTTFKYGGITNLSITFGLDAMIIITAMFSHLAVPGLALSSASNLVHSAAKTCYPFSRVDLIQEMSQSHKNQYSLIFPVHTSLEESSTNFFSFETNKRSRRDNP
jgi:hypothetical protein